LGVKLSKIQGIVKVKFDPQRLILKPKKGLNEIDLKVDEQIWIILI